LYYPGSFPWRFIHGAWRSSRGPSAAKRLDVIDAGFVGPLKLGHMQVQKHVMYFDKTGVIYADGSRELIDVVVAATGSGTGIDKLLNMANVIDDKGQPLFRSGQPPPEPGLCFVGFDETVRGQLHEINRE